MEVVKIALYLLSLQFMTGKQHFFYCLLIILPVGAGGSSVEQAGVIATGGLIRPAASPQLTDPLAVTHRRAIGFEGVWCGSVCVCE